MSGTSTSGRARGALARPSKLSGKPASIARGSAEVKYQWKGEVPYSALLLRTVLACSASPSGLEV